MANIISVKLKIITTAVRITSSWLFLRETRDDQYKDHTLNILGDRKECHGIKNIKHLWRNVNGS